MHQPRPICVRKVHPSRQGRTYRVANHSAQRDRAGPGVRASPVDNQHLGAARRREKGSKRVEIGPWVTGSSQCPESYGLDERKQICEVDILGLTYALRLEQLFDPARLLRTTPS